MSYEQMAYEAAVRYGLDPRIFMRQIWTESRFQPGVVSSAGAIGLGQLMPDTARSLGVDPRDPAQNLDGAARLMRQNLDRYGGDYARAIAAYGWGDGGVDNPAARKYASGILSNPYDYSGGAKVSGWRSASISQGFGPTDEPRDSAYGGYAHFNKGIDFAVPEGTPIDATVGGTVIAAGDQGDGWGMSVKVRDAQGNVHNYGHLSSVSVTPGQQISAGTVVGDSGNTGASTGPHLSYDVKDASGAYFDPSRFLGGGSESGGMGVTYDQGIIEEMRKTAEDLLKRYREHDPEVLLQDVLDAVGAYHDALDYAQQFATNQDDRAQREFDNAIKRGDFQADQADRAYARYADKRDAAKAMASDQIQEAPVRNEANAAIQSAFTENQGQGPVAETRTYIAPRLEEAVTRWNEKLGVGNEPSGNPSDYPAPDVPKPWSPPAPAKTVAPQRFGVKMYDEPIGPPYPGTDTVGQGVPWKREGPPYPGTNTVGQGGPIGPPNPNGGGVGVGVPSRNQPWWRNLSRGLVHFAGGTAHAPGGMAMVGEKGQETMIGPDGTVMPVGQYGPEVRDVPEGSAILPTDVPPEEAQAYAQIMQAMRMGGDDRGTQMAEQAQRANDPQLQEKVLESLKKALAANDAVNPPPTPELRGNWSKYGDPWQDWRGLTGVPSTSVPQAMPQAVK